MPPTPPTAEQLDALMRLASGIVRSQGNRFIKELLRDKGIPIGSNKDDFERNLRTAVESGNLTLADVDSWLRNVEGWGDQHVYLYVLSPALEAELDAVKISQRARAAELGDVWNKPTLLEFPEEPELTSISFMDSVLRLVWQESSPGWTPVPSKNYLVEEGLDVYEYRAYRKVERRAVTRFEARLDLGLAALFIADPIQGQEHQKAIAEAQRVISKLLDWQALEGGALDVSTVSRNLDQRNLPSSTKPEPEIRTQKSRLASGGSYVEFAANSKDKAYWEEPAIREVRGAVRTKEQIDAFQGSDGVFLFQPGSGEGDLTRPLRVQLYGGDNRIRLWAQMDALEVWTILTKVARYRPEL